MRYLVTGKEMKQLDENTSQYYGVPPIVLMEQAANGFVQKMLALCSCPSNVLVVCGLGNNGGDGIAIARLLNQRGIQASIFLPKSPEGNVRATDSFQTQYHIYKKYGYPVAGMIAETDHYDVVIDAIFGTGLSKSITGEYRDAIDTMNNMKGIRFAVDIASGLSSDNGEILGIAFCADHTITFSYGKIGQFLWNGIAASGKIHIVPIGINKDSWMDRKPKVASLEKTDLQMLPSRKPDSHKGTFGKLLVIAGSESMAGASILAAKAAYRAGVGMVKVVTPEENRIILQTSVPEAILSTYHKSMDRELLIEDLKWADAVVIGPGLGTTSTSEELLRQVLKNVSVPLVIDADGLNILAKEPELLMQPHLDIVVTPHLGEMARLTGDAVSYIKSRLVASAQEFARRYDVICVLKDARTFTAIPYGCGYLNTSGNNGMATAGSGDVLSGVIGGLLAQGMQAQLAAPLGVYLHGLAGDVIRQKKGAYGMMAGNIVDGVWEVLAEYYEFLGKSTDSEGDEIRKGGKSE